MNQIAKVRTNPCIVCHETGLVEVPLDGYIAWTKGEFIQDALPELSADDREMLLTGTHPECWDKMFPEKEE